MSKCLVSWCQDDGLDGGLLPGLCVQHRDETLGKQKEALAQNGVTVTSPGSGYTASPTVTVYSSPDVFTAEDRVRRLDGACGIKDCRNVGTRQPSGQVRCGAHAHGFTGDRVIACAIANCHRRATGTTTSGIDVCDWHRLPAENVFQPLSSFLTQQCVKCGKRSGEVCEQMPQVERDGKTYNLAIEKVMLCNACVLQMEQEYANNANPFRCTNCGRVGATVHMRVDGHRAYSLYGITPKSPLCDVCCVKAALTPVAADPTSIGDGRCLRCGRHGLACTCD